MPDQKSRSSAEPGGGNADSPQTRVSRRGANGGKQTAGTMPLGAGNAGNADDAAEVSATAGTMHDPFEARVLAPIAEGLRQYLVIRVGRTEPGLEAYAKLRDRLVSLGVEALSQAPGARARAYRLARELTPAGSGTAAPRTLPWFRARASASHETQIAELRARGDADRELLELRFARGLDPAEIAFVVDAPIDEVTERLRAAEEEARKLLERGGPIDLPVAIVEAFALERTADPDESGIEPLVLPGVILDGRYQLEKHVGSGGFADVYRARDVAVPGHVVALKLLKRKAAGPEARDHALRELRLIAAVFHPSIVQFKDHGWYDDRFWFVMPWYEGESLEQRIEREPLTRAQARRIFEPLARALATMHASKIRHQDVKPDNIFLAKIQGFGVELEERVLPVLLDLGVAATDAELVLAGTPTYFAPEVAAQFSYREGDAFPDAPIGPAADVFALALSLRNALEPSTQPQVREDEVESFIRSRAREVPPPLSDPKLRYLRSHFARWLALDPAKRPTADELAEELAVLTLPEERRERRLRVLRVFGPIVLALLVVFGVVANELVKRAAVQAEKAERLEAERAAEAVGRREAEQQAEELSEAVTEARADIESAQLSRSELERRLVDAEARMRVSQSTLTRTRRQLQEAQKAREALETSLASTEAAARRLEAQLAQLRQELAARESELAEARRLRGAAEARVTEVEARASATERERDAAQRAASDAQAAERAATSARDEARAAAQAASQESARLERELSAARRRIEELERQLASRPSEPTIPRIVVPTPELENTPGTAPGTAPTVMVPSVMTRSR